MLEIDSHIQEVLFTEEEIADSVAKIAKQISDDYRNEEPIMIPLLKGAAIFASDLFRALSIEVSIDYLNVSSYRGTESTGKVTVLQDLTHPVKGRDVILIDEIIDSGTTAFEIKKLLLEKGAKNVKLATFLDKKDRRKVDVHPDYVGHVVPDLYLVGYGMDYKELYRNLPMVRVYKD